MSIDSPVSLLSDFTNNLQLKYPMIEQNVFGKQIKLMIRIVALLYFIRFDQNQIIVADLQKYPNPLRLFTSTRDEWLCGFIESFDIPMHVFSAVRDTQLGQLMFAIESVRIKRKKAGEDPGPGLLDGENATMFVPLFSLVNEFKKFFEAIELTPSGLKRKIFLKKHLSLITIKESSEWFGAIPEERLDEIYVSLLLAVKDGFITPLMELIENINDLKSLEEQMKEVSENLSEMFSTIYLPELEEAILNKTYETKPDDTATRIYDIDGEKLEIGYADYHSRVNFLYGVIFELRRFLDAKEYSFTFQNLESLLTLEMLIMLPQPDKQRITLVKEHIEDLKRISNAPKAFYDLISTSYQTFSQIEGANQRIVQRLYKAFERNMKTYARNFWTNLMKNLASDPNSEKLITVIWCHLRAIQSQAQYIEQQTGQHSHTHGVTIRLEHIFWVQGRNYLSSDMSTSIHFWSSYAFIANKQVRSEKDSYALFHELDALLSDNRILTNKQQRKKLSINDPDHYSIFQRILSYGLESRDIELFDKVEHYLNNLESLLETIDLASMHENFSLDREKQVVKDIRTHMGNMLANTAA